MSIKHAKKQIRNKRFNFATYWLHHQYAIINGLHQLTRKPLQTLMTIAVLSITLVLPTTLLLILSGAEQVTHSWQSGGNVSVYLSAKATPAQIAATEAGLQKIRNVKKYTYISPDQGLAEFSKQPGIADVVNSLGYNPLPPMFVVEPLEKSASTINALIGHLEQLPNIDSVKINMQWVQRLNAIIQFLQRLTYGLAFLLALGLLLIIGNTIRLAVQSYHTEIEITKLVGGTDAFIRRPFLYSGVFYGLAGGLFAALLLDFLLLWLQAPLNHLMHAFNAEFALPSLTLGQTILLLLFSTLLGYLGSWLAVARRLRQIQIES